MDGAGIVTLGVDGGSCTDVDVVVVGFVWIGRHFEMVGVASYSSKKERGPCNPGVISGKLSDNIQPHNNQPRLLIQIIMQQSTPGIASVLVLPC